MYIYFPHVYFLAMHGNQTAYSTSAREVRIADYFGVPLQAGVLCVCVCWWWWWCKNLQEHSSTSYIWTYIWNHWTPTSQVLNPNNALAGWWPKSLDWWRPRRASLPSRRTRVTRETRTSLWKDHQKPKFSGAKAQRAQRPRRAKALAAKHVQLKPQKLLMPPSPAKGARKPRCRCWIHLQLSVWNSPSRILSRMYINSCTHI